jgi:hypothetical protein
MTNRENFIEELKNKSSILNLKQIQEWLSKHEDDYLKEINISSCRKWSKWITHREIPYPCVCPKREKGCVFIELYYKVDNFLKQEYIPEHLSSEITEIDLVTQNKPYKKIKILIQKTLI